MDDGFEALCCAKIGEHSDIAKAGRGGCRMIDVQPKPQSHPLCGGNTLAFCVNHLPVDQRNYASDPPEFVLQALAIIAAVKS